VLFDSWRCFPEHRLETTGWDKNSPPLLPEDVTRRTRAKYLEAYERLTGRRLEKG